MSKQRPNLVLLILDTQRADRLSSYGYGPATSPYLDKLAAEATRFAYPVAPAQWTLPAHASLFTGLYPSQHTTYQMDAVLPAELTTLAERLQRAGYWTAGFSHNPLVGLVANGLRRGFEQFTNYHDLTAGLLAFTFSQTDKPARPVDRLKRFLRYVAAESLGYSRRTGLHRLSPVLRPLWQQALGLAQQTKAGQTRRALAAATRLLAERPGGRPVFVFINLMGAHIPYQPPPWAIEQFMAGLPNDKPARYYLEQANQWQVDVRNWLATELDEQVYRPILSAAYDAEVAAQDAQVGWLLEQLRTNQELDRTFLVITSDHGDHLGEQQRVNHLFGVYQPLVHVPLIIRDPAGRLPPGGVVEPFVSTRRIFHTLLAAAGAASAAEERLALSAELDQEAHVVAEAYPPQWAIRRIEQYRPGLVRACGYDQPARAVYAGEEKVIVRGEKVELYAVRADPAESRDLSQTRPARTAELRQVLAAYGQAAVPTAANVRQEEDDPAVLNHLRNLGYIE